jgi:tripartite-type tricarboxylate transporter receptor subunit TctC
MISKRAFLKSAGATSFALFAGRPAFAAITDYPSRPVRWIVPYTAGGATDVLSRLICQHLTERLG